MISHKIFCSRSRSPDETFRLGVNATISTSTRFRRPTSRSRLVSGHNIRLCLGRGLKGSISVQFQSRESGARFTKCITIYHKIIVSLSYKDRRTTCSDERRAKISPRNIVRRNVRRCYDFASESCLRKALRDSDREQNIL